MAGHIKITGNTLTDTFDFYFDGTLQASANPFYENGDDIANIGVGSDTYAGGAYQIYVDDISISYVPEPGTITLLAVGLLGIMRQNRAL